MDSKEVLQQYIVGAMKAQSAIAELEKNLVDTSDLICCIVSYIAKPAVTEPPGELMYSIMSFSGFSLSNNSICATTRFATISSIGVPRKIILSLKSLEKMSKDLSPRDDCSITTGTKLI